MSSHSLFPDDAVPADMPGGQTVGHVMRSPTTIEPDAHLAAAAYLMEHVHDPALVVVTDDTDEPVAMITDADEGRRLVGMVELADLFRVGLAPGPLSAGMGTS